MFSFLMKTGNEIIIIQGMKILVISDLHNDLEYTKAMIGLFKEEKFDKMYILGDIIEDSIRMLNPLSEHILAVKGNCDGNEEEELARFPLPYITYDYAFSKLIVLTHGHYYSPYNYDEPFDIMLLGHSHQSGIYVDEKKRIIANPGSISRPRDGYHSYMVIDEKGITIFDYNSRGVIDCLKF